MLSRPTEPVLRSVISPRLLLPVVGSLYTLRRPVVGGVPVDRLVKGSSRGVDPWLRDVPRGVFDPVPRGVFELDRRGVAAEAISMALGSMQSFRRGTAIGLTSREAAAAVDAVAPGTGIELISRAGVIGLLPIVLGISPNPRRSVPLLPSAFWAGCRNRLAVARTSKPPTAGTPPGGSSCSFPTLGLRGNFEGLSA